jgi:hypothetical protein
MGFIFTLYGLLPFFFEEIDYTKESYFAGACLLFFAGLFLFVGIQRFTSGLRLIEAYNEVLSIRFSNGESIYPDPETAPMGTIYTPFFFIISGILHKTLPAGFAYGRLISIVSTLATSFLVYRIAVLRKCSVINAIWASAVFFATYSLVKTMYDQSFADSLLMLCTCTTLYYFLLNTPKGDMYALFFAGLSCFTKQTALYPFIVVFICILISRRKLWVFSPLILWGFIAGMLILITKGWAYTYLVTYPLGHGFRALPPPNILNRFFLWQFPLWVCVLWGVIKKYESRFLFFFLAVLVAALFGVFKVGGWFNALLPIEPLLCIAAADLLRRRYLLLLCQLLLGIYNPFAAIYPWGTIRNPDREIVSLAKDVKGEVWLPIDTYLYKLAEKREWDNICALFGPGLSGYPPPERLINALKKKTFDLIIIRETSTTLYRLFHPKIKQLIEENYDLEKTKTLRIYRRIKTDDMVLSGAGK